MTSSAKFQVLLPLFVLLFLMSWQFPTSMIKGKLLDLKSGECIENAIIRLYTKQAVLETKSDEYGRFRFEKLKAGHYSAAVFKSGYNVPQIEGVEVYEDEPSYIIIKLKAKLPEVFSIIKED